MEEHLQCHSGSWEMPHCDFRDPCIWKRFCSFTSSSLCVEDLLRTRELSFSFFNLDTGISVHLFARNPFSYDISQSWSWNRRLDNVIILISWFSSFSNGIVFSSPHSELGNNKLATEKHTKTHSWTFALLFMP